MRLDLADPDLGRGLELDSVRHHLGREAFEAEREKRNRAKALGWNIMEVTWRMYTERPTELCHQVRSFLGWGVPSGGTRRPCVVREAFRAGASRLVGPVVPVW